MKCKYIFLKSQDLALNRNLYQWTVKNNLTHCLFPPAPCPPTQLMVNSSCKSNNISVSWQASQGSVSYMAVAENEQGRRWSCNTSSTSCQISGLLCGQQYNVYVVGIDDKCTGAKSDMKKIRTGNLSIVIQSFALYSLIYSSVSEKGISHLLCML